MSILSKSSLRKIFLDKTSVITNNKYRNQSKMRQLRHMRKMLQDDFDNTWILYENKKATYNEWEKALDKWIQAELI